MTFRQFNKINDILTHTNLEILLQEYTDECGYIEKARFDKDTDIEYISEMIKKYPNAEMVTFDGDFTEEIEWR